jgi:archaellum component FlaF (FlaF/FlaG flagellin family)
MGFDSVASQAIIFIAVISASAFLVMAFQAHLTDSTSTMAARQKAITLQMQSEIFIESVYYNDTASQILIYAKNTGRTQMYPSDISTYINNLWVRNTSRTIEILTDTNNVNTAVWDPKEVILITVNDTLTPQTTHTAMIRTSYTVSNEYEFTV